MANRSYIERMALSRSPATPAAPASPPLGVPGDPGAGSTKAGDGLQVADLWGITVSVYANTGQTLSGGGNLFCWIYNADAALWTRIPDLDYSMSWLGVTVQNARTFPVLRNVSRYGARMLWLTNSLTVSGGTDVLVRLDGFLSWHAS